MRRSPLVYSYTKSLTLVEFNRSNHLHDYLKTNLNMEKLETLSVSCSSQLQQQRSPSLGLTSSCYHLSFGSLEPS
jgi:hypothetical protein